jgi:hypothetical protein
MSEKNLEKVMKLARERKPNLEMRRVSPKGVISLPLGARLALGFVKDKSKWITVHILADTIVLGGPEGLDKIRVRATARGLLQLPAKAHEVLNKSTKGFFKLTVDETKKIIHLNASH